MCQPNLIADPSPDQRNTSATIGTATCKAITASNR